MRRAAIPLRPLVVLFHIERIFHYLRGGFAGRVRWGAHKGKFSLAFGGVSLAFGRIFHPLWGGFARGRRWSAHCGPVVRGRGRGGLSGRGHFVRRSGAIGVRFRLCAHCGQFAFVTPCGRWRQRHGDSRTTRLRFLLPQCVLGRFALPTHPLGEGDYRGRGFFIFFFSFREESDVFHRRAVVGGFRVGGRCVVLCRCAGERVGVVGRSARTFPLTAVPFCAVALRSSARTSGGGHLSQGFGGESAVLAVEEEEVEVFHHAANEGGVFVEFVAQRVVVEFGRAVGTVAQVREHHHIEAETRGAHLAAQLSALADAVGVGFEGKIGTE